MKTAVIYKPHSSYKRQSFVEVSNHLFYHDGCVVSPCLFCLLINSIHYPADFPYLMYICVAPVINNCFH